MLQNWHKMHHNYMYTVLCFVLCDVMDHMWHRKPSLKAWHKVLLINYAVYITTMVLLLLILALLKYFPAHSIIIRATAHCLECCIMVTKLCLLLGLINLYRYYRHVISPTVTPACAGYHYNLIAGCVTWLNLLNQRVLTEKVKLCIIS